jgi:hypothetical protein
VPVEVARATKAFACYVALAETLATETRFARPAKSVSGVGFVRSRLTETPDEPKGEKKRVVREQPSALSARHTERRRDGSGCLMANPKTTLYVGACPR